MALPLVWCSSAQGRIEGQIISLPFCGARLNIASAFAVSMGMRATAGFLASQPIERRVEFAWCKDVADLDFLSPLPPVGCPGIEDALPGRLKRPLVRALFQYLLIYAFFFSTCSCSPGINSGSAVEDPRCNWSMRSCRSSMVISVC